MLVSLVALLSFFARRVTPLSVMVRERTFIAVKPDGVQRGLTGEIIKRFEAKGFKLVGMKFMQVSVYAARRRPAGLPAPGTLASRRHGRGVLYLA